MYWNGNKTEKGIFGADMKVSLVNDGPVTILLDSKKYFRGDFIETNTSSSRSIYS